MPSRQDPSAVPADLRARPTLRDVAAIAGVSFKTVSRVVNGEAGVRPETAERVQEAIRAIGFRRNDLASRLKRGSGWTSIGLVIEDVANPFFSAIARAVEEVARSHGVLLITASSDEDADRERQVIDSLVARRVDGLLVVPAGRDHRYLRQDIERGLAVVFVDRPPMRLQADTVLLDNVGGAQAGVRHLLEHGHRRIALLGDRRDVYTIGERYAGYRTAMAEAGAPIEDELVRFGCHDTADAERAVSELLALPRPPTAIFATNNRMTVGTVQALAALGAQVALVGFDDFELAGVVATPVSVIAYDPQRLGHEAAELLFARMADRSAKRRMLTLPTWLIPRASGEIPVGEVVMPQVASDGRDPAGRRGPGASPASDAAGGLRRKAATA